MSFKKCLFFVLMSATAFFYQGVASLAFAQYPDRSIKFIIPFPPGGGTDTLARIVARGLEKTLQQNIIVENKPGAGTNIGSAYVANAPADGYTVLVGSINMATNAYLYKKLPYDPEKLIPLDGLAYSASVIVTSSKKSFHNVQDLIEYSKKHPGKLNFASYGVGSSPHLGTELLRQVTGIDATHIPYQGGGPALNSVLSGETDFLIASVLPVSSHIKSGGLRALGVAADKRLSTLPDVPTLKEQGINMETGTWFGFFMNAQTPPAILDKLEQAINTVMQEKEIQEFISKDGAEPLLGGRQAFADFVSKEKRRWKQVIESGQISAD